MVKSEKTIFTKYRPLKQGVLSTGDVDFLLYKKLEQYYCVDI